MISKRGATGVIATIRVLNSAVATGAGLTGLTYASSGLVAAYRAQGQTSGFTAFALSAGTLGVWSSGGFAEVDSVNAPGVYEVGLPNAALASGNYVDFYFQGAANMAPSALKVELVAYDPQDTAHLGLVALPNAAAGSAGGLPLGDGSGAVAANNLPSLLDASLAGHSGGGSAGAALGMLVNSLTESYAANGEPATLAQLLYGMMAVLANVSQSGTTLTAAKLDGTTPAMEFTLDSATAPTARRRVA
jgi:hypothetical protein